MSKQEKIEQLMALVTGQIRRADISPRLVIHFNKERGNVHLINGKQVDTVTFHNLLRTLPAIGSLVTTGRTDNAAEYYY
jgi:hypothetical protein